MLLSFSGFLVAAPPVYFAWISKINFITYAQAALMLNEFQGLVLYDAAGKAVDALPLLPGSVLNGLGVWQNIAVVAAMVVGMRLLAFLALEAGARRGRA